MVAVAIGGAALIGGASSVISGNKAAKAQQRGAEMSDATQRYFYDTTREDQTPYRETGYRALDKLSGLYGVGAGPGGGSVDWQAYVKGNPDAWAQWQNDPTERQKWNNDLTAFGQFHYKNDGSRRDLTPYTSQPGAGGDYGGFTETPGYQFRRDEGLKAIDRSSAARGLLTSGAADKARMRYADGLASSEYDSYANRLAALAGVGQTSTQATSAAGAQAAQGISAAQTAAGNARASSYANTGSAINGTVNNLASLYLYQQGGGFGGSTPQWSY
jgi:hypothetical protein